MAWGDIGLLFLLFLLAWLVLYKLDMEVPPGGKVN